MKKLFLEDPAQLVHGERHVGIVIRHHQVLLIHRLNHGREYYVFPGGHRRISESGEDAVIREVYEETAVRVIDPRLIFKYPDPDYHITHFHYLCRWKSGTKLKMLGEEKDQDPVNDIYQPLWMDTNQVSLLNLLPESSKLWFLKNFHTSKV